MFEIAAFSYGLLASFIISGIERNHRAQRAHPPILLYFGYFLCATLGGIALGLGAYGLASVADLI